MGSKHETKQLQQPHKVFALAALVAHYHEVVLGMVNSLRADYARAGKVPTWNIFSTCTRSSHAFRKRVWISPIRRKTVEMTAIKEKELLELTSESQ